LHNQFALEATTSEFLKSQLQWLSSQDLLHGLHLKNPFRVIMYDVT